MGGESVIRHIIKHDTVTRNWLITAVLKTEGLVTGDC